MSDKRHFTVVEGNKEHGLFVGRSPSSVAKKVVSKLSKGKKVTFYLREITQGSKKKVYGPYEGYKKKLKEPRKVGERVYKYESVVKKIEKKGGDMPNMNTFVSLEEQINKTTEENYIFLQKMPDKVYFETRTGIPTFIIKEEKKTGIFTTTIQYYIISVDYRSEPGYRISSYRKEGPFTLYDLKTKLGQYHLFSLENLMKNINNQQKFGDLSKIVMELIGNKRLKGNQYGK